ncbi:MAG: KR domain-containing protein, partial [bacterium]|nr:KR domain-containing protein [bacterium]
RAELEELFADVERRGREVKGVFHAAGVVADGTIRNLTRERIREVLEPKILGAQHLCELTADRDLDFLVFFSSIAGVVGSAGQANYGAANSFLDALACRQSAAGRRVLSLCWGPWAGAGMTGQLDERLRERMAAEGVAFIDPQLGVAALQHALELGAPQVVVWSVDWERMAAGRPPELRGGALLDDLLPAATQGHGRGAGASGLAAAPAHQRPALVRAMVAAAVARVLGYRDASLIDPAKGFTDLGMDSLLAMEVVQRLRSESGQPLPATLAFEHPSIDALTEHLCSLLGVRPSSARRREARAAAADEPIAIVGMACRFPGGADTPERFWELLAGGVDTVTEIPPERWDHEHYYHETPGTPGKISTRSGAFIERPGHFDCGFFDISPREAAAMDPQHRLALTLAWEALEDAAAPWQRLRESRTGVFVGIGQSDYALLQMRRDPALIDTYMGTGSGISFAAGRISSVLGLRGPAKVIDTACSSSLVALHDACASLRAGEC